MKVLLLPVTFWVMVPQIVPEIFVTEQVQAIPILPLHCFWLNQCPTPLKQKTLTKNGTMADCTIYWAMTAARPPRITVKIVGTEMGAPELW